MNEAGVPDAEVHGAFHYTRANAMADVAFRVFISYAREANAAHQLRVRALADRLMAEGIETIIDLDLDGPTGPVDGWSDWCRRQIAGATFVLMVCSETYRRRFDKEEEAGVGIGATWEGHLIRQEIQHAGSRNSRFVPIVFDRADRRHIPSAVADWNHYCISLAEGDPELRRLIESMRAATDPGRRAEADPARAGSAPRRAGSGSEARPDQPGTERGDQVEGEAPPEESFLERMLHAARLRQPGPPIASTVAARQGRTRGLAWLDVRQRHERFEHRVPIGVVESGLSVELLDAFVQEALASLRAADPEAVVDLVYGGDRPSSSIFAEARRRRIRLVSSIDFIGRLLDLRGFVQKQSESLERDIIYPPALFVPQRLEGGAVGVPPTVHEDALAAMEGWMTESDAGRLVLLLGDFGAGKTFLLRKLALSLARTDGAPQPILLSLGRMLKNHTPRQLVAAELAQRDEPFDPARFDLMLREGRIALLFDGYDELELRVTFDTAHEQLRRIIEGAAVGAAKVVIASRTQHFETDSQVETTLLQLAATHTGLRKARLRPFDEARVRQFLINEFRGDSERADQFQAEIGAIPKLPELSQNPRLLGMIARLGRADFDAARHPTRGHVDSAKIYQILFDKWFAHEAERAAQLRRARGHADDAVLSTEGRWNIVTQLAVELWDRPDGSVPRNVLTARVAKALESFQEIQRDRAYSSDEATQIIASGTLLVRDAEGNFSFLHQSVMEWLVAKAAAADLGERSMANFARREASDLMIDFFVSLAQEDRAIEWARRALREGVSQALVANALRLLQRVGAETGERAMLAGRDLSGQDLSRRDLVYSDCTGANFKGAILDRANFTGAVLDNANFEGARMRGAVLHRASIRGAIFDGADLCRAVLDEVTASDATSFDGARLLAARGLARGVPPALLERAATERHRPMPARRRSRTGSGPGVHPVTGVAWLRTAQRLAIASADGVVRLWNVASGQQTDVLDGGRYRVHCLAAHPTERVLAAAWDDMNVRLWNVESGTCSTVGGHDRPARSLAWSPSGDRLAVLTSDGGVGTLHICDTSGHQLLARVVYENANGPIGSGAIAWHPGSETVAVARPRGGVILWDARRGTFIGRIDAKASSLAWHPDGSLLATVSRDGSMQAWGSATWTMAFQYTPELEEGEPDPADETAIGIVYKPPPALSAVAWSPTGERVAVGAIDGTITLLDGRGVVQGRHDLHTEEIGSLAWDGTGERFFSGSLDGLARVWHAAMGGTMRAAMLAAMLATRRGWVSVNPAGRYRSDGETSRFFWFTMNGVRFEAAELDELLASPLQLAEDEALIEPPENEAPRLHA